MGNKESLDENEVYTAYQRPSGKDLGRILDAHIIAVQRCTDEGKFHEIREVNFPFTDGSPGFPERKLREFVEFQDYVKKLLELARKIPEENRPFNEDEGEFTSSISRCVEKNYPESLKAVCEYAKGMKIATRPMFLLAKYLPVNEDTYSIAREYGYRDLSYEGIEDTTPLNMTHTTSNANECNAYVGYRISYHTFYYMNKIRIKQMLDHWLKIKYRNCTVDAVVDLYRIGPRPMLTQELDKPMPKDPAQLSSIAKLLDNLKLLSLEEGNLSVEEFEATYWEKGHVIEPWMYL